VQVVTEVKSYELIDLSSGGEDSDPSAEAPETDGAATDTEVFDVSSGSELFMQYSDDSSGEDYEEGPPSLDVEEDEAPDKDLYEVELGEEGAKYKNMPIIDDGTGVYK